MLNDILNAKGIKVLNRKEQKLIKAGGGFDCTITIDGNSSYLYVYSSGSLASAEANSYCVDIVINSSAQSCSYNCNYDGMA